MSDRFIRKSTEVQRGRDLFAKPHTLPNPTGSKPTETRCNLKAKFRSAREMVVEDYYKTTLAACSSWTPQSPVCESATISNDEILCIDKQGITSWSRQTGFGNYWCLGHCTAVAVSRSGVRAAGFRTGTVLVSLPTGKTTQNTIDDIIKPNSNAEEQVSYPTGIAILRRHPSEPYILVTDSRGRVLRIKVLPSGMILAEKFEMGKEIRYLSVSDDERLVAVSTMERSIVVLSNDGTNLRLLATFALPSVTKGFAFCPVGGRLLAAGGGRHDCTLRLLRLDTHKLFGCVRMPGQIVGVVWLNKLEVFVAIGHSRTKEFTGLGQVVNVADRLVVSSVSGRGYAINAAKTQDGFCVNTTHSSLLYFTWKSDPALFSVRLQDVLGSDPTAPHRPLPQLR